MSVGHKVAARCRYLSVRYVSCVAVFVAAVRCMCSAVACRSSPWVLSRM